MISLEELEEWKKKRDAVILAHYYVRPEVQALADYIGDSYFLSKKATELANKPSTTIKTRTGISREYP